MNPENKSSNVRQILIAPYSNDYWRDWPEKCFVDLVHMLVAECGVDVELTGNDAQADKMNLLQARMPKAVVSTAGKYTTQALTNRIQEVDLVISNNSGVGHLASGLGVSTLVIMGGSVSPEEWAPRGPRTLSINQETNCSPCADPSFCPYGKACLAAISPLKVYSVILENFLS